MKERVSEGVISDIAYVDTVWSRAGCRLKSETQLIHSMQHPSLFLRHFDIIGYWLYHTASALSWVTGKTLPMLTSQTQNLSERQKWKAEYCVTNLQDSNPFPISLFFLLYFDIHLQCLLSLQSTRHNVTSTFFVLSAYISHSSVLRLFLCSRRKSPCAIPGILRSLPIYDLRSICSNQQVTGRCFTKPQGFIADGQ